MSQIEVAVRRAGLVVLLVAACALMQLPAAGAPAHVVLGAYAVFLLGCAAVLSPCRAVADLARRDRHRARAAAGLRWFGFAGIALYALYVAGDVDVRKEEAAAADSVEGSLLLFLVFLAGVWVVHLSMATVKGAQPLPPAEEDGGGDVDAMGPLSAPQR